jgi:hypothetical protein
MQKGVDFGFLCGITGQRFEKGFDMNKLEYIRSEINHARKEGRNLRAVRLQTLLADAMTTAKNELRDVTEADVSKSAEKFIKGVEKTQEVATDPEMVASLICEKISYEEFVIANPFDDLSLDQCIEKSKEGLREYNAQALAGVVMRNTKGRFKFPEVLEAIKG